MTVVNNAIDARSLAAERDSVTDDDKVSIRRELELLGQNTCIYCGGMYKEKRLDFLLQAARHVRLRIPDFELILVGAGPDSRLVAQAAQTHGWIKFVPPAFGKRKAALFSIACLQLMPGAVGLGVLDSFVLRVPLVTTRVDNHGPEMDYLEDGENGVVVSDADSPESYARAVVELLEDGKRVELLREGCKAAAEQYSVEKMASLFSEGVVRALGLAG
jgi:glycosyltransferase involved in cell wall biosynthesis